MSNLHVTYLVGAVSIVIGLAVFASLIVVPALTAYRRSWERLAVVILSGYVLVALAGLGVVLGAVIVLEWPRIF